MKNKKMLLNIEIIKCINQKEFKVVFSLMLLLVTLSYFIETFSVYGKNVMWLRSVAQNSFMIGLYSDNLFQFYTFFFPLICVSVYSMSFLQECQDGTAENYFIRMGYAKYIWSKALSVFLLTCFSIIIPMLTNLFLCKMTFPLVGSDDNVLDNHFTEGIYQEIFLGNIYEKHQVLYVIIMILINGCLGGVLAILALGISMLPALSNCNPYIFCIGFFIAFDGVSIVLQNFMFPKLNYAYYLNPFGNYNMIQLVTFILFNVIIALLLLRKQSHREEYL